MNEEDRFVMVVVIIIGVLVSVGLAAASCNEWAHCNGGVMVKNMWGYYQCVPHAP